MEKLVTIDELSEQLRISVSMLRKRIEKARKGESDFPLPVTGYKEKVRWARSAIDHWLESQQTPVVKTVEPPKTPTAQALNTRRRPNRDEIVRKLNSYGIQAK